MKKDCKCDHINHIKKLFELLQILLTFASITGSWSHEDQTKFAGKMIDLHGVVDDLNNDLEGNQRTKFIGGLKIAFFKNHYVPQVRMWGISGGICDEAMEKIHQTVKRMLPMIRAVISDHVRIRYAMRNIFAYCLGTGTD